MRLILLLSICLCSSLSALEIGAAAPALQDVTWIKGEAPVIGKGNWAIVEFWATWCPPCLDSIPHLTELAHQNPDLIVIGISNEKRGTVEPFVTKQGKKMDYRVGLNSGHSYDAYMSDIDGIPHAFLVDPKGTIAWHGHPMSIDSVLEKALAGTLDVAALAKISGLEEKLMKSLESNDPAQIEIAVKELLAIDPLNEQGIQIGGAIAQYQEDPAKYRALYAGIKIESLSANQANGLAWDLLTTEDLGYRNLDLALSFAQHAMEKSPDSAAILDTAARARYTICDIDGAISLQQKAVALEPDDESISATLKYYQSVKELAGAK